MTAKAKSAHKTLELPVEERDVRSDVGKLRIGGKIPAVFYGSKTKNTPIAIDAAKFKKVWKEAGESSIVTLTMGAKNVEVLIHDVAVHPITDEPIHSDFYAIDKDTKVTVHVPIEFIGEAPAVKNFGGTVVKVLHELEISGLPKDLPHSVEADLSSLIDLSSHVAVKDLVLPEGVVAVSAPEETIAAIKQQKIEEEEVPAEVDLTAIEVEKKGKKEEEGVEGEGSEVSAQEKKPEKKQEKK